jgi:hypothetical protein
MNNDQRCTPIIIQECTVLDPPQIGDIIIDFLDVIHHPGFYLKTFW